MHQFLSSVGFADYRRKEEIDALVREVIENPTSKVFMEHGGICVAEYSKNYGEYMGIAVRGELDENQIFKPDYYFPYFCGNTITTTEHIDIERHADKEAYAGVCDEPRLGITLIFYVQNPIEYFRAFESGKASMSHQTSLTGLASQGIVILPVLKEEKKRKSHEKKNRDRLSLIEAAKDGDQEAIESLTLEDIDTYSMLSRRIQNEDILSIVNTYFMPYGIESEQYAILGEIMEYRYTTNSKTGEEICILSLNCNNLEFDICINKRNLLGEPEIGRRFKGVIWMQGSVFHAM